MSIDMIKLFDSMMDEVHEQQGIHKCFNCGKLTASGWLCDKCDKEHQKREDEFQQEGLV